MHSDTADFLGSLRPTRSSSEEKVRQDVNNQTLVVGHYHIMVRTESQLKVVNITRISSPQQYTAVEP